MSKTESLKTAAKKIKNEVQQKHDKFLDNIAKRLQDIIKDIEKHEQLREQQYSAINAARDKGYI